MFKNLLIYRIQPGWTPDWEQAQQALDAARFAPCTASQERSAGWVEPRGQAHGPLVESVGGQWLLEYAIETKTVPGSVVKRKVDERAAQIETTEGRSIGKKERRTLKEDITHELLPMAFSRLARVRVWIDPEALQLAIDAGNPARADDLVTSLVQSLAGFAVSPVHTQIEPSTAMAGWLSSQEPPEGFSIDRECELKATDESKSVVRYAKHALDIDEVREHIEAGKRPTRLAMTWDDRVSFELTEGMLLRKIKFREGTMDDTSAAAAGTKDDDFDADVALLTGELSQLLPELLAALGGEAAPGSMPAPPAERIAPSNAEPPSTAPQSSEEETAPF